MERYGRYTFIEMFETPALDGISILAKDGKLVHAEQWDDWNDHKQYFSVISEAEKQAADDSYQSRPRNLRCSTIRAMVRLDRIGDKRGDVGKVRTR
jgi:hypothetical protein